MRLNGATAGIAGTNFGSLRIRTLGSMAVESSQEPGASLVAPGKAYALLVYLASSPGRSARREELLDLLWADRDPAHGRANLRQTVWSLRQRLGDDLLTGDDHALALGPSVACDRSEFLEAIESGNASRALALYGGSFLPALAMPGALGFEQWADGERGRLQSGFIRVTEALIEQARSQGDLDRAITLATRLRDEVPDREAGWRVLIESLVASGERLRALVEAESVADRLRRDGREPQAATSALLRRVRGQPAAESPDEDGAIRPDLVGREGEFAQLLAAWAEARSGRSRHVEIVAPPGLGKSRMLAELADRLERVGGRVVRVRAHSGERHLPWSLAGDLIRALADLSGSAAVAPGVASDLVTLVPTLSDKLGGAEPRASHGAWASTFGFSLLALIDAVADEGPVALLIDDLHWSDSRTREALGQVFNRLERQRVLIVTTARPEGALVSASPVSTAMRLAPLTTDRILELVASVARLPAAEWAVALPGLLEQATRGSPLLVIEALTHLGEERLVIVEDGSWTCSSPGLLAAALERSTVIEHRLESIAPLGRRLLLALSVAGVPVEAGELSAASGSAAGEVETALLGLERLGLVRSDGSRWEPVHDEIAAASLRLDAGSVPDWHRRWGTTFTGTPDANWSRLRLSLHHSMEGEDHATLRATGARLVRQARVAGDRRPTRLLLAEWLDRPAESPEVAALVPFMPRNSIWIRVAGLAAIGVALVAAWAGTRDRPTLVLVADPVTGNPLTPPPIVELHDPVGRLVNRTGDSVFVTVVNGAGRLVGDTVAMLVAGRAEFGQIEMKSDGPYVLEFRTRRFGAVRTDSIRWSSSVRLVAQLEIVGGRVAGQTLSGTVPGVTVERGAAIGGTVDLVYTSYWPAAAVFLCAAPNWGNRATSWTTLTPVVTPIVHARRTVALSAKAPERSGAYWLVLGLYADRSCEFVMSGTNWTAGTPVWGDGNDVAWLPDDTIAHAIQAGVVTIPVLRAFEQGGPRVYRPTTIGFAGIRIVVR